MQCSVVLRVRTEWLGDKKVPSPKPHRVFRRAPLPSKRQGESRSAILIDNATWLWKIKSALEDLELPEVSVSSFHLPLGFEPPSLRMFVRYWHNKSGTRMREEFEGIQPGANLTIPFTLSDPSPEDMRDAKYEFRRPTLEEAEQVFNQLGKFYGLSPFGCQFGLGRFVVRKIYDRPVEIPLGRDRATSDKPEEKCE